MIRKPLGSAAFVGRREELAYLHEEFALAAEGRPRFVLVEGEAGIGKSRLLREFVASLPERTVGGGQCSEHVRIPFRPLAALFAHLRVAASDEKAEFYETFLHALERESARRPIVATIEDLQWADSATLELLAFVLANPQPARALFVATARTAPESADDAALLAFRHFAARNRAGTIVVRPLRRNEVRALAQEILAHATAAPPVETLAQIEALSEGNPLFAEELARVVLEGGTLDLGTNAPLSLQTMLAERLAPLGKAERDVLVRAAIVGQRFDAGLVARIADAPLDDVLAALQRAVEAGLVVASAASPWEFAFRHAMIRQALSNQLILALAAPLHVRIAEVIEAMPDANAHAAELAFHWSAARVAERARYFNERAGDAAQDVHAYRDAIGFYSAALRWEYPAGPARASLYERLGHLLYVEGRGEEPAHWFERCRGEYASLGDVPGTAHALLRLADQHWVDARTGQSLEAASAAAGLLAAGAPERHAEALLTLARFSVTLGDAGPAGGHLRAVESLGVELDLPMLASLHETRAETYAALGEATPALRDCRAASALAARIGTGESIAQVENNVALVAYDLGELDYAVERHTVALSEARRTSMPWRVAYSALNFANTLMLRGDLAGALKLAREALGCGVDTATFKTKAAAVGIPLALALDDRALLEACADERALDYARRSREVQRIGSVFAAFAQLRAAQGATAEAQRLVGEALETIPRLHRSWNLLLAARTIGGAENARRARALLQQAHMRPRIRRAFASLFGATGDAGRAFDRLGFTWAAARVRAAFGPRAETGSLPPTPPPQSVLSARQREVARLVARGQTNRSIAAALHISEHTVEHHLSSIFARLGLRSRSALAALIGTEE